MTMMTMMMTMMITMMMTMMIMAVMMTLMMTMMMTLMTMTKMMTNFSSGHWSNPVYFIAGSALLHCNLVKWTGSNAMHCDVFNVL